mmetsp:Transcript_20362/g.31097  ORF Transcript_20362/g.31097 Transcript_20362/m.31097 type:complete len:157 (-) Transcript_20362:40-510(-)
MQGNHQSISSAYDLHSNFPNSVSSLEDNLKEIQEATIQQSVDALNQHKIVKVLCKCATFIVDRIHHVPINLMLMYECLKVLTTFFVLSDAEVKRVAVESGQLFETVQRLGEHVLNLGPNSVLAKSKKKKNKISSKILLIINEALSLQQFRGGMIQF